MSVQPQQQQQQQQQQQMMTTNVIVQGQPQASGQPQNIRDWTTGMCGCFEDCGSCIMGYFCLACLICKVTSKMGECVLTPWCCPQDIALMMMRAKLRTMYGIKGALWKDVCAIHCCFPLAVCQMDREMQNCNTQL